MRNWLIKIAVILVCLFSFLASVEWYAIRNDHSRDRIRADWFFSQKDSLEGLIFGPSYVAQSINTEGLDRLTANLGLSGSSPNVDAKLILKTLEYCKPDFILLNCSTGALERRHDKSYFSSKKLYFYYGIDYDGWTLKDAFFTSMPLYRYLTPEAEPTPTNEQGFALATNKKNDVFRKLEYDSARIVNFPRYVALKDNVGPDISDENFAENKRDLLEVIELCRKKQIKLILLAPPLYAYYNDNLKPGLEERSEIFLSEVVDNETVFHWDYQRFYEDEPRCFTNCNHMSLYGAKLFTAELNRRLNDLR